MENEERKFVLFGFRTNKTWKKILSIIYLIFCILFSIISFLETTSPNITTYDFVINKIDSIVICLIFFSPYIFLSESKLRKTLPLFKENKIASDIIGLWIINVVVFLFSCFGISEMHSKEYKADMENHAFKKTVISEATCDTDGEIDCLCEYCGLHTTEVVNATGHKMVQVSSDVSKCEICGKEDVKVTETTTAAEPVTETTTEPEKVVTFTDIYTEYKKNELAADDKFKGNRYEITGIIESIGDGGLNGLLGDISVTVTVYANGTACYLWCTFDEKTQRDILKNITMGETITFEGTCSSWGNWYDCKIIQ